MARAVQQRMDIALANEYQRQLKAIRREEEKHEEEGFRVAMLAKFAEDEVRVGADLGIVVTDHRGERRGVDLPAAARKRKHRRGLNRPAFVAQQRFDAIGERGELCFRDRHAGDEADAAVFIGERGGSELREQLGIADRSLDCVRTQRGPRAD